MTDFSKTKTSSESRDGNEDIPSDFFDDFCKEDFIEGLNVIDTWNDSTSTKQEETRNSKSPVNKGEQKKKDRFSSAEESQRASNRSTPRNTNLDEYIKPGSRRDPAKTNAAILKDKEVKVKNHLAKHLEAATVTDLCPPGTELDDYFEDNIAKRKPAFLQEGPFRRSKSKERYRDTRRHSPLLRRSPYRSPRRSPLRVYRSPMRDSRPLRRYNKHMRRYEKRSPTFQRRHYSPYHSKKSPRRSRSPVPRKIRRSRSLSRHRSDMPIIHHPDRMEPLALPPNPFPYQPTPSPGYPLAEPQFTPMPDYYGQGMVYPDYGSYGGYTPQPPQGMIMPQPPIIPVPDPPHIPPVIPLEPLAIPNQDLEIKPQQGTETPYDALEKLVEEGKLSKEDYLKLTPNKGASLKKMEEKIKLEVLKDCAQAVNKLSKFLLPKLMLIRKKSFKKLPVISSEEKFPSPLKRQQKVEYEFTQAFEESKNAQQNKAILNSIISTLDLEKQGTKRTKSKPTPTNMKDASVQTSTPFCDACAIRETITYNNQATSIDEDAQRLFSSTVHTQVIEQDLLSSKTFFNPSGSSGGNSTISIAHMTPAQLVSQLAARAKSLKQNEAQQSSRNQHGGWRNPPHNNYDGRGQRNNTNFKYF